jgi:hypothetical protein
MLKGVLSESQTFSAFRDLIEFNIGQAEEVQTVAANASNEYSMRMTLKRWSTCGLAQQCVLLCALKFHTVKTRCHVSWPGTD